MCVFSMVVDHYQKTWPEIPKYPDIPGVTWPDFLDTVDGKQKQKELEKRIEEMEELLRKAKIYDEENNEPDCESETKKKTLQELADLWEVEINFPD